MDVEGKSSRMRSRGCWIYNCLVLFTRKEYRAKYPTDRDVTPRWKRHTSSRDV